MDVRVSELAYAADIVRLSYTYRKMQSLLEAVNCHGTAVGLHISGSKTVVMSAVIRGEQRQAVLLDGEPLEDADESKHLSFIFIANG